MIVQIKPDASKKEREHLETYLRGLHVDVRAIEGETQTILGLVGDTSQIDIDMIKAMDMVLNVQRIQEPYKRANRKFHKQDSVVRVGDSLFGGGHFTMIAGPCSVESRQQVTTIANAVKKGGAGVLRGGAFKPRTSPYAFQGLKGDGIELLLEAKKESGLPIVSEIMDISQLPLFERVDMIQVGARNMQNFALLRELGRTDKPILLKRGLSSTIEEWMMSAEYIMAGGNEQIVLCERGIRTFETKTRNTLDLSAIAVVKELSHLPVIVDPSHATGYARFVAPMAMAAAAAGADGLIIEVHNDPAHALCDGPQSITPESFEALCKRVARLRAAMEEDAG